MGKRTLVLDQLVNDQRIAQGWADALRGVAPDIDNQLQECLGRLTTVDRYLPTENAMWRAFELPPPRRFAS